MFDADKPITNSNEDRLNRAQFSKYLARALLDHKQPESLVVGLYGGWGTGKTSVINLMIEELLFAASNMENDEKPIILNFSAWSYSGQDQLIYSFFRRLSSTLRDIPYLQNGDRIIHLLELYVSFFTRKPIPKALRTHRTLWEKMTFQGREEVYAWESGRDLTLVKTELNELLLTQKHKIIIIIDNISRLDAREMKQIFQIVKSIGNYFNTEYVLAFDKAQVIYAINRTDGRGGAELIEKVVQLPFHIPPITQQDLEPILADRLSDVLRNVPEEAWNKEYWADVYYASLKYFFFTCRDITRFINALNFSYPRLRDLVNPVDFFALTALEVFTPDVYAGIRDNKDLFTDLFDHVYETTQDEMQKEKMRCDEILMRQSHVSTTTLLTLLIKLFPRLHRIYHPDVPAYHSDAIARKLKRVCSPDLFDVYFRLALTPTNIPSAELKTLLAIAEDPEQFDQVLTRLNQDERILKFLDLIDSTMIKHVPLKHAQAIMNALIDNGDLFPIGITGPLNLDTPMQIHRIIHELLIRFPDADTRFAMMQEAISKANKSIYIIVHELKEQSREHLSEEDTFLPLQFRDLTPDALTSLKTLTASRIENWANTERLVDHPQLIPLLFAWRDWGNPEKVHTYVKKITDTDRGLIAFLCAALNPAISEAMVRYEMDPSWPSYLNNVEAFIPTQSLIPHAKTLFEDNYFEKLREREQLALMIFLDLTKTETNKIIPKTTV